MSTCKEDILTIDYLQKRFPNARFIAVSPHELQLVSSYYKDRSILVVQADRRMDTTYRRRKRLSFNVLTADDLITQYPQAMFQAVNLKTLRMDRSLFTNRILLLAKPQSISVDPEKVVPSINQIKKQHPNTTFRVYRLYDWGMLQEAKTRIHSPIVFIAWIEKEGPSQPISPASQPPTPEDIQITGSCISDLSDLGNDDVAVVLFVIIGVFVVAALIVYAGKYIYDVATSRGKYGYWWEIGPSVSVIEHKNQYGFKENGILAGVKVATGFTDRNVQIGLAGEAGLIDANLYYEDKKGLLEFEGLYGMAGPAIRLLFYDREKSPNPSYLLLELLAGTSEHEEAGLLSLARIGLNWRVKKHLRIGLNIGALYFDLKETESIIKKEDNFRFMGGIGFGYRF